MSNSTEANRTIDIQEYAARLPDSKLLAGLGQSAISGGDAYYDGWWDQLRQESADGSLPVDAAVAAYYSVIHPVDTDRASEELGPEQARRLTACEKVVSLSWDRFDPRISGVLAADAIALLGHPDNPRNLSYADVRLGLQFTDRRDVQSVFPANKLIIGDKEITDEYRALMADPRNRSIGQHNFIDSSDVNLMQNTALLQKFDLIDSAPDLKAQRHRLMETALATVLPENVGQKDNYFGAAHINPHVLELLPAMHVLDHDATELRIREFASFKYFEPFKDLLVQALAEIRSPMAMDSLSLNEQEMWKHRAAAEIYETRCLADEIAAALAQSQIRGRLVVASMVAGHHADMKAEQSQRDLGRSKKPIIIRASRRSRGNPT